MNPVTTRVHFSLTASLLCLLCACDGDPGSGDDSTPPSVAQAARVEIVQTGLLFTQEGETRPLDAQVFDDSGAIIDVPVSWSSTDAVVAISAEGIATAEGRSGSSQIVASAGNDVRSPPLLAVVTTLAANTIAIDDAQVVRGPVETDSGADPSLDNTYTVILEGVDPPLNGLIVGTGSQAVAGRVVKTEPAANGLQVTLQLVPIDELFPELDINETFDLAGVPVDISPEIEQAYEIRREADALLFTARESVTKADDGLSLPGSSAFAKACEVEIDGFGGDSPPVRIESPPVFKVSFNPSVELLYTRGRGLERLLARAEPRLEFALGMKAALAFEGRVSCRTELFTIPIPLSGGALSWFFGGVIPVGLGFDLEGRLSIADAAIGVESTVGSTLEAGLVCQFGDCEFRREMGEFSVTQVPTLDLPGLDDVRFEPSLHVYGYAEAAFGNRRYESLRFELLEARLGSTLAGSFAPQITQVLDTLYRSDYALTLDAGIRPGDGVSQLLSLLSLETLAQSELTISTDLALSPGGTLSAEPSHFEAGDNIHLAVTLDPERTTFLGLYNVEEILLLSQTIDDVAVVARRTAVEDQSEFQFDWVAEEGVNAYFAFVVTRALPLELLSLEVADVPGVGTSAPVYLRQQSASSLSRAYCAYEQGECDAGVGTVSDSQAVGRNGEDGFLADIEVETSIAATASAEGKARLALDRVDGTLGNVTVSCDSQSQRGADDGGADNGNLVRLDFKLDENVRYRVVRDQTGATASGAADDARSSAVGGLYFTFGEYSYQDQAYEEDDPGTYPEYPIESGQASGVLAPGDHSIQLECGSSVAEGYGIGSDGGFSASAQARFTVNFGE